MTTIGEVSPQRRRLAARLRALRRRADLDQHPLAERLQALLGPEDIAAGKSWSQARVSRIELGQSVPQVRDVALWAAASGATPAETEELIDLAGEVVREVVELRRMTRQGLARTQHDIARLEAAATAIRNYSLSLIPGLLQTADVARRLLEALFPAGRPDIPEAVQARLERQRVIYDPGKEIEFVLAEAALRPVGPAPTMRHQLATIAAIASLPNVSLGVIPQARELPVWHWHGFDIFETPDETLVYVETLTAGLAVTDPEDVQAYRGALARLREAAIYGDDAQALMRRLISALG